jgi:hypothetical protein
LGACDQPNEPVNEQQGKEGTMSSRSPPTRVLWLALAVVFSGAFAGPVAQTSQDFFYLSVRLQDPFNSDLEARIPIKVDKPFQVTTDNGDVKNTISGRLHAPSGTKYPLTLTISEWSSEKSNMTDSCELQLEIDKPWSGGPIATFIYLRTVVLSKKKKESATKP